MPGARITAVGCYTPPRTLTNDDLSHMVETTDKWILERTGIRTRCIADPDMATSDMAIAASRVALDQAGVAPSEIDAILCCTVTPDHMFPATACLVQHGIGANRAWGFDISAACSSFVYGLTTAAHLVAGGSHKKVLVVGSDTMSRIIDYTDRATCVLFGDGAGAMIVEAAEDGDPNTYIGCANEIDGSGAAALRMPAGGSRMPPTRDTVDQRLHFVKQDGQAVFKFAVRKMYDACRRVLEEHNLTADDVKILIPHQANRRIICAAGERLGVKEVLINIEKYGNTTAATIPLATRDALEQGRLKQGDLVLFAAVGAGFTVGANLWRWAY
ncbi:MAG TPA: beta-ketoacyl-ACP synthase III [Bryobacteraceae bacterium]|nr:beta-ketoacyl-ACP synthase III [Bryobacteraceae bacterium]